MDAILEIDHSQLLKYELLSFNSPHNNNYYDQFSIKNTFWIIKSINGIKLQNQFVNFHLMDAILNIEHFQLSKDELLSLKSIHNNNYCRQFWKKMIWIIIKIILINKLQSQFVNLNFTSSWKSIIVKLSKVDLLSFISLQNKSYYCQL